MLQVWLLGQFEIKADGHRLVLSARAAQSLLAYLMLSAGTPHRREKLAGLLWSELPEENARRNLRHEIWRIRKALVSPTAANVEYILADELTLTFNPDAPYWLDAAQFQHTGDSSSENAILESLSSNLSLYRGELLPGMYDDWISLERERLQAVYENKMQMLLEKLIAAQRWNTVIEWSERWIAHGQTPEPAYRALMLAHAASGNRAQIAGAYKRCQEDLERELGVEPSEETNTLYQEIMRGERVAHIDLTPTYSAHVRLPFQEEPPAPGEPPFKGLEFFDEPDADLFFGREDLTAKLVQEIHANQFLAVIVGASGSGKSSIVRAGLIPALRRDDSRNRLDWRVLVMTPTAHPLEALALALTRDSESVTAAATLMDDLARDPRSLNLFLRRMTNDERRTGTRGSSLTASIANHPLLVVDQFEELFTLCRDELEREQFIDNLLTALFARLTGNAPGKGGEGFALVLTLRADFYAHLAQYPELRDAVAKHQEFIGPMTSEEVRRAIQEPARSKGWDFEPGLVDLILRDVGDEPGALPLLSHALLETWKRRSGHTLTYKGYHDAGGVRGAIAQTAENVYQQFSPHEQIVVRDLFLRLTELGEGTEDTRRRASFEELMPRGENAATVREILTRLADARLITLHQDTAEVAHEALIREWHRLREWLNQDRDSLRGHRQITEAANEWEILERDAGALYRGARLIQARDFAEKNPGVLNAQERDFVEASDENEKREARERAEQLARELRAARELAETQTRSAKQLRRRAVFLTGAFILAVLLAAIALFLNNQSRRNALAAQTNAQEADSQRTSAERSSRVATARELAANAVGNLEIDPERSILLALAALNATASDNLVLPEVEDALHRAVLASRLERTLAVGNESYRIKFTPDGKQIATISLGGIRLWDVETGELLRTLPIETDILGNIAFSQDGTKIATMDNDGQASDQTAVIRIFDRATGALLSKRKLPFVVSGDIGYEGLSPDWSRAAIPINRGLNLVEIFDLDTGKVIATLAGHTAYITEATYSPDGKRIITISNDATAKVWDAETGKELLTLEGITSALQRALYSPDGKKIATAERAPVVRIWDAETGKELLALRGHSNSVQGLAWSPDGKQIASSGLDPKIILWDAESGEQLDTIPAHTDLIWDLAFSPDQTKLVSASKDNTSKIWDLAPNHEVRAFRIPSLVHFRYSRDQRRYAFSQLDGSLTVANAQDGKPLLTVPPANHETHPEFMVALNADGSLFAAQRSDGTVGVWDVSRAKQIASFPGYAGTQMTLMSFSPEGKLLATANSDGSVRVWDVTNGQSMMTTKVSAGTFVPGVAGARFSPDGKRLLAGTYDGKLYAWDLSGWKELFAQKLHTAVILGIEYSPDGKRIVTTSRDRTAKVSDAETGQELFALVGHSGAVFRAVYSPDGQTIATAACDGLKLWDAETGQLKLTLYGGTRCLDWVEFTLDGKRVITSSEDGGIREYLLEVHDLAQLAKKRLTRTWTLQECRQFLHVENCPAN